MEFKEAYQGSITLTRDDWGDKLWNQVGETIRILTHSGYQCRVRNDEPAFDIIVIDFAYESRLEWGSRLVFMDEEQFETFVFNIENQETDQVVFNIDNIVFDYIDS